MHLPHGIRLAPNFMLQADELTWLSPSLFSQAEAVKPQPMLNLPGSSDIDYLRRRSS